jgi:carboxypeptidase family protein/carboxypeptidase-like protein
MKRRTALVVLALLLLPVGAAGQAIVGRVLQSGTGLPVEGALVTLLDAQGTVVQRWISGADGRYSLSASTGPGEYSINVDMIGFATVIQPGITLGPGELKRQDLSLSFEAVVLEGISVSTERRCSARGDGGSTMATLWSEVKEALTRAELTQSRGTYVYDVELSSRRFDARRRRVQSEESRRAESLARSPFRSRPAAELMATGFFYEDRNDDSYYFFGPDAAVLLSEEFEGAHCFGTREGRGERAGLIGLTFEPVRGSKVGDIAGVLWVDPVGIRLQEVEFSYVDVGFQAGNPDLVGGRVSFAELPNGTWIVDDWRLWLPVLETHVARGLRPVLAGIVEEGGRTVRVVERRTGNVVIDENSATVAGVVLDSLGIQPIAGALIEVMGADRIVQADAQGRFVIEGLMGGVYGFRIDHPYVDSLPVALPPIEREVAEGTLTSLPFRLPSRAHAAAEACRIRSGDPNTPTVQITVRSREGGEGIPGARTRTTWRNDLGQFQEIMGRSLADGTFATCGPGPGTEMLAEAWFPGGKKAEIRFVIPQSGISDANLIVATSSGFPGLILGRVVDVSTGAPVGNAEVQFPETGFRALTDIDGTFTYRDVPPGIRQLTVEHLGFVTLNDALEVQPRREHLLTLNLAPVAFELEELSVAVERTPIGLLQTLQQRIESGRGAFIQREDISARGTSGNIMAMLRGSAGLRTTSSGAPFFPRNPRCIPDVLLDGVPVSWQFVHGMSSGSLETIEVYPGPSSVPTEFGVQAQCGLIVAWTRRGR